MTMFEHSEYNAPEISILLMEMNDVLCDSTGTDAGIDDLTEGGTYEW